MGNKFPQTPVLLVKIDEPIQMQIRPMEALKHSFSLDAEKSLTHLQPCINRGLIQNINRIFKM